MRALCVLSLLVSLFLAGAAAAGPHSDRSDHMGSSGMLRPLLPPTPPLPPPEPPRAQWDDASDMAYVAGYGTIGLCETAASTLNLIPVFGPPTFLVAQWFCIAPGAIAVDYVALHHGGRDAAFWQAGVALASAKAFSDLTRVPQVLAYTTTFLSTAIIAIAAAATGGLEFIPGQIPDAYQPLALTGYVTGTAVLTTVLDIMRVVIADLIYHSVYDVLTGEVEMVEEMKGRCRRRG